MALSGHHQAKGRHTARLAQSRARLGDPENRKLGLGATSTGPDTPKVIVSAGWRDKPLVGPDSCAPCEGWGTLRHKLSSGTTVHRTCPDCAGKGYK